MHLEWLDYLVLLEQQELQDNKANQDPLELEVHRDQLVQLVPLVLQELLDL